MHGHTYINLYSFFNLGTRWRWVVNATPPLLYPRERDRVPIVERAGFIPGPVWTGAENLAPPGFDHRTVQSVKNRYTDCVIPGSECACCN